MTEILSINGKPPLVIDDSNYKLYVPDENNRLPDGSVRFTGCMPPDKKAVGLSAIKIVPWEESKIELYDDQELKERLEDLWAAEASIMHTAYDIDALRQTAGTCWIHGTCQAAMLLLRLMNVPDARVSPASVAYNCYDNYGQNGGWPHEGVVAFQKHGACSIDAWPENGFNDRYDTPDSQANRIHYWLEEAVDTGSGAIATRRQLSGFCQGVPGGCTWAQWNHYTATGYGRNDNSRLRIGIWNSWGPNGWGDRGWGLVGWDPAESYLFPRMRQSPGPQ